MIPPKVPNGFHEWPSIEFPQFLRELGFTDTSYHNDLCARATRPLEGYGRQIEGGQKGDFYDWPCIVAWCEHERPEDREDVTFFRYDVHIKTCEYDDSQWHVGVYCGDDADKCRAAIQALHGRVVGFSDDGACLGSIVGFGQDVMWVLFDSEEWRSYDEREDGAIRYRLKGGEWSTPDGASGVVLIDLMEVKK